ncbi:MULTISPECIES: hypothetical protein [Streptomyces]|uniref:hypothetical protein n=1 Tax=Streptomyces TaxID=1883 RepID=UPI0004CC9358|nr:hypothetical protein [Streptomyces durhamensis]
MSGVQGGLPYEECRRYRAEHGTPYEGTPLSPGYAIPPFHPGHADRHRHRHRRRPRLDGATVSGVLTVLCVATLLVTIVAATTLPA